MHLPRRIKFLVFTSIATLLTFVLFHVRVNVNWDRVPQAIGLGDDQPSAEQIASGRNILPDLRTQRPQPPPHKEVFPPGTPKPAGSNYTRAIVIARTKEENVDWIDEELGDILAPNGPFEKAIYVADDSTAPLHPPKNKGHEVMIYLSYIIDHYDALPDVAIFMHSHRFTWHNNELLDTDAAGMIRYLSPERVTREGYMNLRCHWDPGCPDWLHPGTIDRDASKSEEIFLARYWPQLYPGEPVPQVLSQACCAQFALSRERIRAIPLERYVFLRDWVLRTNLVDFMSGRMFEYTWQYLFTGNAVECPALHVCYCDGYGFCFGGAAQFNEWFETRYFLRDYERELEQWNKNRDAVDIARDKGRVDDAAELQLPEVGRDVFLKAKIASMTAELQRIKDEAFFRGLDPKIRAEEAGRPWEEGDGF